jgi:hypothetical protein
LSEVTEFATCAALQIELCSDVAEILYYSEKEMKICPDDQNSNIGALKHVKRLG